MEGSKSRSMHGAARLAATSLQLTRAAGHDLGWYFGQRASVHWTFPTGCCHPLVWPSYNNVCPTSNFNHTTTCSCLLTPPASIHRHFADGVDVV